MAKKIQIRGVIVGSGYDSDWMKPYIAKGVLTPESTIREALTSSAEDVEIYINSQGGSVFAARGRKKSLGERTEPPRLMGVPQSRGWADGP